MNKRAALGLAGLALAVGIGIVVGCSPQTDLGGAKIPNVAPDTRITGQPPSLLEAGFMVRFYWSGTDPDGSIRGFQYKITTNSVDGISVQDSLTFDPVTGDTLNPWHFTTSTDSIFIVDADMSGFPGDAQIPEDSQRAFQPHTLFIRAVDDEGAVDPTPAYISFTATTLLPTIQVDRPSTLSGYTTAAYVPPSVTFGWDGSDPDFELNRPTQVRFMWKRAYWNGQYIRSEYAMRDLYDKLVSFSDSAWGDWRRYSDDPEENKITFEHQPERDEAGRQIAYLFAIQARDTAGAVSIERVYGKTVHNVVINSGVAPQVTVEERFLEQVQGVGLNVIRDFDIAPGQNLEFSWTASAQSYAGEITGFRYGWDVGDPDDENDPGWQIGWGISALHKRAPITTFDSGTHTLVVQARDNSGQKSRITILINVVPVQDPNDRRPCLLVDDVLDQTSNAWLDQVGNSRDNDTYRDNFWEETLVGSGGVEGFAPNVDIVDMENDRTFEYRDMVGYRAVIWTTRYAEGNFTMRTFKPPRRGDRFNWLHSFQEKVGNLFLIGERVLNLFVEDQLQQQWMLPIIFNTTEEQLQVGDNIYSVGFGTKDLPDGTTVLIGPERYPYRTLGVSLIDHVQPKYYIYGTSGPYSTSSGARAARCAGVKGLILDPTFRDTYIPGGGAFPDTIFTDPIIDWKDVVQAPTYVDQLMSWSWGNDEFYDANITDRSTPWAPMMCDGKLCVEPMFRIYSRYDWIMDQHIAAGDFEWPANFRSFGLELNAVCGAWTLDPLTHRTLTTGLTTGFVSNKLASIKPTQRADVVWGFDPYRFNREEIKQAIHWVLGEHFGLFMQP